MKELKLVLVGGMDANTIAQDFDKRLQTWVSKGYDMEHFTMASVQGGGVILAGIIGREASGDSSSVGDAPKRDELDILDPAFDGSEDGAAGVLEPARP